MSSEPRQLPSPEEVLLNLEATLPSIVSLRADIPEDALTASVLGTRREGHGVVINDSGLILTIGYLVTEATSLWITVNHDVVIPGHVAAYDQETGFGLVQALQPLPARGIALGSSADLNQGERVVFAGHGGLAHAITAEVVLKREFAGYWEYLLDEAIFTAPAHPNWGGGALLGADGTLRGIGSLLVHHVGPDNETFKANMVVPIDLLKPILNDLLTYGRQNKPSRPWLGMMTTEYEGHLVVAGVTPEGPADQAGIEPGDVVVEVDDEPVSDLAEMFRRVWGLGEAGVSVPLTIYRNDSTRQMVVDSGSRGSYLKRPTLH